VSTAKKQDAVSFIAILQKGHRPHGTTTERQDQGGRVPRPLASRLQVAAINARRDRRIARRFVNGGQEQSGGELQSFRRSFGCGWVPATVDALVASTDGPAINVPNQGSAEMLSLPLWLKPKRTAIEEQKSSIIPRRPERINPGEPTSERKLSSHN
jgi:hypothetical protein